jgi:hypothetical protein
MDQSKYLTFNEDESYYLNQIVTNEGIVTGFSWNGNKNIYSTKNGIFESGTNQIVINNKIDDIRWSDSFNAVVKSNNTWKILDYKNKKLIDIPVDLQNPIIDNQGKRIADFVKNSVFIYNTDDFKFKEVKFEEPVKKVFFASSNEDFVVSTNFATKSYIYSIDSNFTISKKFDSNNDYTLSSISLDGKLLALVIKNKLSISDFNTFLLNDNYLDKSSLNVGFRSNTEFVVVEKYKDNIDRILDNIYISNVSGKRFKLSDSRPLINRINTDMPIVFNDNKSIATFGENKGKTWILSLKSNLYPTYSNTGDLVFSNIKPSTH